MSVTARKLLIAFALARPRRLGRRDLRPLQPSQEPGLHELLRHQRDGVLQGGVSEPLRLGRGRAGRRRRHPVFRLGAAARSGARAARAGSRTARRRTSSRAPRSRSRWSCTSRYASFFVLKEVCPLCVATYVAVIGVFVDLRRRQFGADVHAARARDARHAGAGRHAGRARHRAAVRRRRRPGRRARFRARRFARSSAAAPPLTSKEASEFEAWWEVQPAMANFPVRQRRREGPDRRVRRLPVPALQADVFRLQADPRQVPGRVPERRQVHLQDLADQLDLQRQRARASISPPRATPRRPTSWPGRRARRRS